MSAEVPPVRRRGEYANTAFRRKEIVRVAIDHFARFGYQGASLRAIAAEVGITPSAVFHHFATKEELLAHVLLEYRRQQQESLTDLMNVRSGREALIQGLARDYASPGQLSRLWVVLAAEATNPDHPAAAFVAEQFAVARGLLADTLRVMQRAGEIRADADLKETSVRLLSLAHGLHVQGLISPEVDPVAVFSRFLDENVLTAKALRRR